MLSNFRNLRHELKYYINLWDYMGLRERLKHVMERDTNSDSMGDYNIRSLYFDDFCNSALYEKNFGVNLRQKYRIRIYNNDDRIIKLERKSKIDSYTCKESKELTKEQFYKILRNDIDFMLKSDNEVLKDFYAKHKYRLLRPRIVVDYDREAYIIKSLNIRVTFDKELRAGFCSFDIFSDKLISFKAFEAPIMIMEVKYNEFLPDNIRNMLQKSSVNQCAASKYAICRVLADRKRGEYIG